MRIDHKMPRMILCLKEIASILKLLLLFDWGIDVIHSNVWRNRTDVKLGCSFGITVTIHC